MFDDVNDVIIRDKKYLLYPHQLKITEKSDLKAIVVHSYFKGGYWLIELKYKGQKLFVNHPNTLEKNKEIYFELENTAKK